MNPDLRCLGHAVVVTLNILIGVLGMSLSMTMSAWSAFPWFSLVAVIGFFGWFFVWECVLCKISIFGFIRR